MDPCKVLLTSETTEETKPFSHSFFFFLNPIFFFFSPHAPNHQFCFTNKLDMHKAPYLQLH